MGGRDATFVLICGYPAAVRREPRLSMFVSYIDESGKGGAAFVAGGLTAKGDPNWLRLSDQWGAILREPPAIPAFHFSDTQGLSNAEHWQKIDRLIEVINNYVDRCDLLVIDVAAYKAFFAGKVGITFDNPFLQG